MVRDIFAKGAPRHLSYHTALIPKLAALFRWLRFSCLGIEVLRYYGTTEKKNRIHYFEENGTHPAKCRRLGGAAR